MSRNQRPRIRIVKPGRPRERRLATIPGDFDRGYVLGACVVSAFYGWIAGKLWQLFRPVVRLIVAGIGFVVGLVWFAFALGAVCWIAEHLVRKYNR